MRKKEMNETNEIEVVTVSEALLEKDPLVMLADAAGKVEKVRVAAQVRITHLGKRGRKCPETEELLNRSRELEDWVDKRLAQLIKEHPASHWFTQIKGTGGELIGKVIGHIEAFGRFYDPGDPQIPGYVNRPPVPVEEIIEEKGKEKLVVKPKVWVEGIERVTTPAKLRKYAGLVPGQRKILGQRLGYNEDLRVMLRRLGSSFLRSHIRRDKETGEIKEIKGEYGRFYLDYKARLTNRFVQEGYKILPTPEGRYCLFCEKEVVAKTARFCPACHEPLSLKEEPEGVKYVGHIHSMAQRRMLQLFLDHLWVVWREALGLPLRQPYPIEYLGHSRIISPWDMVDK
jgi:hypothetical protein